MKVGPADYFKLGDYNAICDRCATKFKASELRREWQGFMVCDVCFEPRHPQDLIIVRPERRGIPWSRPAQNDYILGLAYNLIADGSRIADGSVIADGGVGQPSDNAEVFVVFGPVNPDSLGWLPPVIPPAVFEDSGGEPGEDDRREWHDHGDTSWDKGQR